MNLVWTDGLSEMCTCRACGDTSQNSVELQISRLGKSDINYTRCDKCESLFVADFTAPNYEISSRDYRSDDISVKYYVEQGAGMETLVLPAMIARQRSVSSYLEIGCGFGFGLDFARTMFSWRVKGIDPGTLARAGRRQLGVDIESRYVTETEDISVKYDTVVAIEVIEHFDKPEDLLTIMKRLCVENGLLILTTPNARYIEKDNEKNGLLAALSPGFHAVLLSKPAAELLLKRAGFNEFSVVERGATLLILAGQGAAGIDADLCFDAQIYRAFLEKRCADARLDSAVRIGYMYRLFKALVNENLLDESAVVFKLLEKSLFKRDGIMISDGLDLLRRIRKQEVSINIIKSIPACLPCILFFRGIYYLNKVGDGLKAAEMFFASAIMANIIRRALLTNGVDDGELNVIETQARLHASMVLDVNAPWKFGTRLGNTDED